MIDDVGLRTRYWQIAKIALLRIQQPGAVTALSRSTAAYYAPQAIRVNVVAPGLVRTPASEAAGTNAELAAFLAKKQTLRGGMIDAEEVARLALFLLIADARSITGQVIAVERYGRVGREKSHGGLGNRYRPVANSRRHGG